MPKPLRLTIFLLVAPAVVASGCGSTKTASTNASTSAPNQPGPQTVGQSTSSTEAQHTTSKAREPKAAEAKPQRREEAAEAKRHREQSVSKRSAKAAKPKVEAAVGPVPPKKRYPREQQLKFIVGCEAEKGSNSSCECVLVKQELRNVATGQSLAELLALEFALGKGVSLQHAMRDGVPFPGGGIQLVRLPRGIQRSLEQCQSTSK